MAGETLQVLGGIDEAGLGPILGPLVVAGMVLAGPAKISPWDALHEHFCKKPESRKDHRIRVDDSKRVKSGVKGHRELERTVLSLWYATQGRLPEHLGELLGKAEASSDLSIYPWYRQLESVELPRWQSRDSLELESHLAAKSFAKAGLKALTYAFRLVDVACFNALIRKHDNKGLTLFDAGVPVLRASLRATQAFRATQAGQHAGATIVADRHGARGHYRRLLQQALPGLEVHTLSEAATLSRYSLGTRTEILFSENGEDRAFPCAAASCLAKYIREVCVERLNAYVSQKQPGIKKTAGYWTDGKRFLAELGTIRREMPEDLLVRIR